MGPLWELLSEPLSGTHLGPFGGPVCSPGSPFRASLGPCWSPWSPCGGRLGTHLGHLGPYLVVLKFRYHYLGPVWDLFGTPLGPSYDPFWGNIRCLSVVGFVELLSAALWPAEGSKYRYKYKDHTTLPYIFYNALSSEGNEACALAKAIFHMISNRVCLQQLLDYSPQG